MSPRRTLRAPLDLDAVRDEVAEWYGLRRQAATLSKEIDRRKGRLKEILEKYGEEDPVTGSIFLQLGKPVDGVAQLKNQKATTKRLNYDLAEEILTDKGMWEEMTEIVREVDQAAVNAAFYDNRITKEELDQMFPESVTYSFYLIGEDGKQVRI